MIRTRAALLVAGACLLPGLTGCSLFTRAPEASDNPSATRLTPSGVPTAPSSSPASRPVTPGPTKSLPPTSVKPPAATLSPAGIGPLLMGEEAKQAKTKGLVRWSTERCPHWEVLAPSGAVVARATTDNRQESGKVLIIQAPGVVEPTEALATSTGLKIGASADDATKAYPAAKKLPGTVTDFLLVTEGKSDMWVEIDRTAKKVVMITVVPSDPKRKPDQAPPGWFAAPPVC